MALFPGAIPVFTGFTSSHTLSQDSHASQHNLEQAEIVNIATKVGTGSSTSTSGTLLRGTGAGTSAWQQVTLTSDVTGVLPVANGGLGQATLTGLTLPTATLSSPTISGTVGGSATYTTPTLTAPTMTDFNNAPHNHQNATGGGTLNAANALQAGSVSFANLLSTIFSGQVLTQANAGSAGGTMNYINLGGIKLLWITTANQNSTTGGSPYTITLPTSFFSTVTSVNATATNMTTDGRQYIAVNSFTTTTVTMTFTTAINGTTGASIFVIGT